MVIVREFLHENQNFIMNNFIITMVVKIPKNWRWPYGKNVREWNGTLFNTHSYMIILQTVIDSGMEL